MELLSSINANVDGVRKMALRKLRNNVTGLLTSTKILV